MSRLSKQIIIPLIIFFLIVGICFLIEGRDISDVFSPDPASDRSQIITLANIPEYSGEPYVVINRNAPFFSDSEIVDFSFEQYSELDALDRCGVCVASVGQDIMPTEERESIGSVKPSGWQTVKYDFVDGSYLYNRCHLIGFQLTGENANKNNLITGTRYLNTAGMLPFENMVADYVKETGNHVMYRVTPIFESAELVARGVLMEGYSVEDEGEGISFCVYCYNIQPGVEIDYTDGTSKATQIQADGASEKLVINKNSRKVHRAECPNVLNIKRENKQEYEGDAQLLILQGYSICKDCMD